MSRRLIVDASVAVKWLLPEEGSERAIALIEAGFDLYAPDLLVSEIGNVLWKRARANTIAKDAPQHLMTEFLGIRLHRIDSRNLATDALEIACRHDRSFYDSLYLALAQTIDGTLITADARFANALTATPHAARIATLGDFTPTPR